jgi:hypothetical protein
MVQFKVGDVITLCASIRDLCFYTQYYEIFDINMSVGTCAINHTTFGCLTPSGIQLDFQWTNTRDSTPTHSCDPANNIKFLGSATTNSQGIASTTYTIVQNDLDIFNANTTFDLRVCIRNTPNVDPLNIGKTRNDISAHNGDYIIIVPATVLVPTHRIDLIVRPWSWYDANGAAQLIINKLIDIDGAITNFFVEYGIIDYQYINTDIITSGNNVIIRINLRSTGLGKRYEQQYLAIPLVVKVVITMVVVGLIIVAIGKIIDLIFYAIDDLLGLGPALTNEKLTGAGDEFMKSLMDGCVTKTCIDPSLTQDQKAACVKNCVDNALINWKDYQTSIYPDGDHTPLDTGQTEVQVCYDTYNTSSKTPADYTIYLDCIKIKRDSAVDTDKDNTLDVYDPDAPAGEKEKPGAGLGILLAGALGLVMLGMMTTSKGGGTVLIKSEK